MGAQTGDTNAAVSRRVFEEQRAAAETSSNREMARKWETASSTQGSGTLACGLNLGIYERIQFGLLSGCERSARFPCRTPSRHQPSDTLLLFRRKELIRLLGLDDDQCSNVPHRQLGGQGIQSAAGGSCNGLTPPRNSPVHHFALLRRLRQDSNLSHIFDCLRELSHNSQGS